MASGTARALAFFGLFSVGLTRVLLAEESQISISPEPLGSEAIICWGFFITALTKIIMTASSILTTRDF